MKNILIQALIEQAVPLVVVLLVTIIIPWLVVMVGRWIRSRVAMAEQGVIRWVAREAVKYAEQVLPDRGKGSERFEIAARYLVSRIPALRGQEERIRAVIEEAVWQMDAELKAILGEPANPTPAAVPPGAISAAASSSP